MSTCDRRTRPCVHVSEANTTVIKAPSDATPLLKCAQLWSFPLILSSSELFVGHAEGVEHNYTITLMIEARLGLLNGRVECQMVDLRAVFGRSGTQNSALIASRSSGIASLTT